MCHYQQAPVGDGNCFPLAEKSPPPNIQTSHGIRVSFCGCSGAFLLEDASRFHSTISHHVWLPDKCDHIRRNSDENPECNEGWVRIQYFLIFFCQEYSILLLNTSIVEFLSVFYHFLLNGRLLFYLPTVFCISTGPCSSISEYLCAITTAFMQVNMIHSHSLLALSFWYRSVHVVQVSTIVQRYTLEHASYWRKEPLEGSSFNASYSFYFHHISSTFFVT